VNGAKSLNPRCGVRMSYISSRVTIDREHNEKSRKSSPANYWAVGLAKL
jgi:hypothetical protein